MAAVDGSAWGDVYGEGDQAVEALNEFYTMEQSGNFGGSWELFHSQMKKKFEKSTYVQQRAHVFMQDMGTDTFTFELGSRRLNMTFVPIRMGKI